MTKEEAIMKIRMDICIERYMCDGCQQEECEYWLAMKALDGLPSAQRKGKWIDCDSSEHWKCNQCGDRAPMYWDDENMSYAEWLSPYCPNCGADMRGEEDD